MKKKIAILLAFIVVYQLVAYLYHQYQYKEFENFFMGARLYGSGKLILDKTFDKTNKKNNVKDYTYTFYLKNNNNSDTFKNFYITTSFIDNKVIGGGGGSSTSGIYSIYNGQGVTMTGIYAQMLFQFLKDNITATGILNIKGFHFVMESRTPNIYKHTLDSFLKGYPEILHYDKDVARKSQRRREATGALPTKSGMHKDEYPYASTFEGGKNANVAYVPAAENFSQGGSLGVLYGTLQHGDAFMVIPVPANEEPETAKQRSLSRLPQSAPVFVPDTPNFSRPTVPYTMWPVILGAGVIIGVGSYMRFAPIP